MVARARIGAPVAFGAEQGLNERHVVDPVAPSLTEGAGQHRRARGGKLGRGRGA
jgi:hypothetical protein